MTPTSSATPLSQTAQRCAALPMTLGKRTVHPSRILTTATHGHLACRATCTTITMLRQKQCHVPLTTPSLPPFESCCLLSLSHVKSVCQSPLRHQMKQTNASAMTTTTRRHTVPKFSLLHTDLLPLLLPLQFVALWQTLAAAPLMIPMINLSSQHPEIWKAVAAAPLVILAMMMTSLWSPSTRITASASSPNPICGNTPV